MIIKQTKIVATISDKKCDIPFLKDLYDNGMNVVRINTAHQTQEDTLKVINNVRQISDKIPILIDTKGPEIRTTKVENPIEFTKGDIVKVKGNPGVLTTKELINVSYIDFVKFLPIGHSILIDDGSLELVVIEKNNDFLTCEVKNHGFLKSNKSVNIPGIHLDLPSLSTKDIDFINFAIKNDINFIAHSFVRNKVDVMAIQKILDQNNSKIKVIAKIENQEGVENIDEILPYVYGVMVARGDLAIEIPEEKIPTVQRMLLKKCNLQKKPVIVATQMLHSMIENPRPTRAEISDIANAVYNGADAIMLSGETASGCYPIEAVKTMTKVALEAEAHKEAKIQEDSGLFDNNTAVFLAASAVEASEKLNIKAIITDTTSGKTARYLSSCKGKKPIFAQCYDKQVMRELALHYGVYAEFIDKDGVHKQFIKMALSQLQDQNLINIDDFVVVLAGNFGVFNGPSFIEIGSARNLLQTK